MHRSDLPANLCTAIANQPWSSSRFYKPANYRQESRKVPRQKKAAIKQKHVNDFCYTDTLIKCALSKSLAALFSPIIFVLHEYWKPEHTLLLNFLQSKNLACTSRLSEYVIDTHRLFHVNKMQYVQQISHYSSKHQGTIIDVCVASISHLNFVYACTTRYLIFLHKKTNNCARFQMKFHNEGSLDCRIFL